MLSAASNDAYKQSMQIAKQFNRNGGDIEQFVSDYVAKRKEYYLLDAQKKVVLQAQEL